jgi:hypothetical protein
MAGNREPKETDSLEELLRSKVIEQKALVNLLGGTKKMPSLRANRDKFIVRAKKK